MSFIFFILDHLPDLVDSCTDANNAVVKSSMGKENRNIPADRRGWEGKELCEPDLQLKKMGSRTAPCELCLEILVDFGFWTSSPSIEET